MHREKINFKSLSVIRAFAAIMVVFCHSRGHLFAGGKIIASLHHMSLLNRLYLSILQITGLGQEAVICFFVLSGFSIAHSLRNNSNFLIFYRNRFLRIYPPYFCALVVVIFVAYLFSDIPNVNAYLNVGAIIKYMFYIKSNGYLTAQYWSLAYEVVFYLLAPLIISNKKYVSYSFLLFMMLYIVGFFINGFSLISPNSFMYNCFFCIFFYFICGAFVYYNISSLRKIYLSSRKIIVITLLLIPVLAGVKHFICGGKVTAMMTMIYSSIIIVNMSCYDIKSKVLLKLGDISYSLYLNHFVVLMVIVMILSKFGIEQNDILSPYFWLTSLPFIFMFSYIMWYLVERRFSSFLLKQRMKYTNELPILSIQK